jgi:hypothetical protein
MKISILSFLLCESAFADSMMLSPAELKAIGVVHDHEKSQGLSLNAEANNAKIRLDGIVFHSEKKWCVWLNGQRFSYGQHPLNYKILKVNHDCVEMILANEAESKAVPIVLNLGQMH